MDLDQMIDEVERASASDDPLDRLAAAADRHQNLGEQADQLLDHFVRAAREASCSWAQVGEVLGVSKQAVQQRHTKRLWPPELAGKGRRGGLFFSRFTDRARASLIAAQIAARELQHNYIGTEHLLIGLLSDPDCLGAKVLQEHGVARDVVVDDVEDIIGVGGDADDACEPRQARRRRLGRVGSSGFGGHIPFTPRSKKVLKLALREARDLDHNYIGTEHILLALLREGDGVAAQVLSNRGLTQEGARRSVVALLPAN